MSEIIGLPMARQLLRQAMETQGPNFIYNPQGEIGCYNVPMPELVPAGHPKAVTGCLVGTALSLSGIVPNHLLVEHYGRSVWVFSSYLTDGAASYLRVAQSAQDVHETWGEAFGRAEAWAQKRADAEVPA